MIPIHHNVVIREPLGKYVPKHLTAEQVGVSAIPECRNAMNVDMQF